MNKKTRNLPRNVERGADDLSENIEVFASNPI